MGNIKIDKANALLQAKQLKAKIEALETSYFFTDLHGYSIASSDYKDDVFNLLFDVEKRLGTFIKQLEQSNYVEV